ncbi:serine protease inhibitor dipetalogastin-like [Saccostrea cucullata]|uniref:serine protease inhibitor dipetalogastin-like n=1 Tax=Saccostrea cuccullata TaxID=36930 RepID=UPI002ED08A53
MDYRPVLACVLLAFLGSTVSGESSVICSSLYRPVCGENGQSYDNACLAGSVGVQIAHQGMCNCPCPKDLRPVCGYNGVTYHNACLAKCDLVSFTPGEC